MARVLLSARSFWYCLLTMFVRARKRENNKIQILIVENIRHGQRVQQKIIRSVGLATTDQEREQFVAIAEAAIIEMKCQRQPILSFVDPKKFYASKTRRQSTSHQDDSVKIKNIRHEHAFNDGFRSVFGELYAQLGFNNVLKTERKIDYWNEMLKSMDKDGDGLCDYCGMSVEACRRMMSS